MTAPAVEVDAFARRMMVRLVDETPMAPSLDSIVDGSAQFRHSSGSNSPRRSRRPLLAAVSSVALITIGLMVVTQLRSSEPAATAPTSRQLPVVVPDGWVLDRVLGPGTFVEVGLQPDWMLFATSLSPLGPIVGIDQRGSYSGFARANTVEGETRDGRRIALSDFAIDGTRVIDVQVTSANWVTLLGRDVSDETLTLLAESATVDADGFARLDRSVVAAAGLTSVGEGSVFNLPFSGGRDRDPGSMPAGLTITSYSSRSQEGHIDVNTYVATAFDRAALGLLFAPVARQGDPEGWLRVDTAIDTTTGWFVERGGFAHIVLGPADATASMQQILDTLRPVDDDTWNERVTASVSDAVAATTVVVDTTSSPAPVVAGGPLEIDTRLEAIDDSRSRLFLTHPDDGVTSLTASFVGRTLTFTPDDPDLADLATGMDVGNLTGSSSAVKQTDRAVLALVVVPTTTRADHARIHIGGTSFLVELQQLDDDYPVAIAALLVDHSGNVQTRVTLMADGQVVEEF